ncbi:sensor histidine kinase [Odoribacter splanchnicus]|uniref:histidine kinase n=1 Tax=Odoribacter splanchnicus TaxID=28118 RepID=A0AAW6FIU1_9BACT|nr:HAMP domain-containing sensor histidine kinase [Odoribacter splanchnicus]MDB9206637.1 HAMP domain-containing sensor histidine kinase [Odoribacter splanchnicus]MDB9213819.1 HAMP domain-containing sensor histidine kinase [Odoribacter splanchnicus]MDB9223197.1 HAMP domain-containing sensor histidine kinase [Odoribacter splanchnicus]
MKTIGQLSVVLLICVLLGQGMWLYHVREIKLREFCESANYVLLNTTYRYLYDEGLNFAKNNELTYGLAKDDHFYWHYDNKEGYIPIKSPDMVDKLGKLITYDCLCEHGLFDVFELNELYIDYLKEKGITENPILKVLNVEGEELGSTGNLRNDCSSIITVPINLGYEYKHQLLATFELPFIFRALSGILWVELIFMIGFIFCLVWQWCSIRMTVRSARIQTMGMTHLEHELKKPLATMISVVNGILEGKDSVLCPRDTTKLTMVKARLMKMADITDTMLTSLKTSVLMINREVIDLKFEMEMTTEMFSLIRPYARVGYRIAEGLEYPCLDKIYFNYVVVNLVDNAIKYGGTHPVVKVDFYTIGDNYVLTVEDNGIGIAPKDQKQIFKQFYRVKNQQVTKTTGFGLGLTFVHKVVCAYGGSIRLESELGIGSKFTITIPQ